MTPQIEDQIVVMGYGNSLRGDDAVGRLVAEAVADLQLPNVDAISCTQLVPELAARISEARAAIFVDARVDEHDRTIKVQELTTRPAIGVQSHITGPRDLLALASACYKSSPQAWLITVPASEFDMTDEVSPTACQNVAAATRAVERLLDELRKNEVARA